MSQTTGILSTSASLLRGYGIAGLFGKLAARAAAMPPEIAGQLRAQQITAIGRLGQPMMAANLINSLAFILVLAIEGQLSNVAIAWAALMVLFALRAFYTWRIRAKRSPPETVSTRAIRRTVMSALLFGLLWSIPGLTFFPYLSGMSLGFGGALLTGMIAGGAIVLYPVPMAALAFGVPIVLSSALGIFLVHGWVVIGPAIIAGTFLYVFWSAILRHADLFLTEFVGRLELQKRNRLIEDLLQDARLEVMGSRRESEERMIQAKKMEAVGQLTSGISHDFNNLLTAIRGNAELLEIDGKSDVHLIHAILQASDRGARQVQRLLSIAQKQRLSPETIDLADLFKDVERIVAPTVAPGSQLQHEVTPGTPEIFADAAQLENALINLIFNARDAMPDGGTITLQARRAKGQGRLRLVEVSVRDTGCGMDNATLERALDPFFTTKAF
ncbi:MAG: histidine kinase dimerization/phospho-acceptor domain-containing protein, partial [Pseudomonadota bacterium]